MLSDDTLDAIIRATRGLYARCEQALIELVAAAVRADAGHAQPGLWLHQRVTELRKRCREVISRMLEHARREASHALGAAAAGGRRNGERDLPPLHLRASAPLFPRTPHATLVHAPAALMPSLARLTPQLLAGAEGMYREVMRDVLATRLGGEAGRLRLAQAALDRAARKGITGYFAPAGKRRWNVVHYVEMASRTAAQRAANDAHAALLVEHGYDLVRVTTVANCSPLCQPFQGRLLSLTGTGMDGRYPVVATLAEARARGLHHPNCRHAIRLWVPSDALPPPPPRDPDGYKATQDLRRLERAVREQKRLRKAAITPQATAAANARIRGLQKQIREHVEATGVPRIRRREQLDMGYRVDDGRRADIDRAAMVSGDGTGAPSPQPGDEAARDAAVRADAVHRAAMVGVQIEGMDSVHPETVREIADAVVAMRMKYPFGDVSRIAVDPAIVGDEMGYTRGVRNQLTRDWESDDLMLAQDWTRDRDALTRVLRADEDARFHPPNTAARGAWSVIVHEFAHVIDFMGNRAARGKVADVINDVLARHPDVLAKGQPGIDDWLQGQLSGYSFSRANWWEVNPTEALAEAFLDVEVNGEDASELARALHSMLLAQVPDRRKP